MEQLFTTSALWWRKLTNWENGFSYSKYDVSVAQNLGANVMHIENCLRNIPCSDYITTEKYIKMKQKSIEVKCKLKFIMICLECIET
jgi:hypothetical protein